MSARRLPRRPEEGWLAVGLALLVVLILAWAMDDPAWVFGNGALTDVLATCALAGFAVGFGGPKVGWGRWRTHLVGAVFAGLLVPILAGWTFAPGTGIAEAFRLTASGTVEAYLDLAWRGHQFTTQQIHYVLTLGGLAWGTAQFAAFAVFGHRRPLSAVVVVGLVLLGNMALTSRDQLSYLAAFAGASLFLLVEMHAFDERATWLRRQIGDPAVISSLYLRGGTVFILVAMAASLVLTQRAASAPLAGAWRGIGDQLVQVGQDLARLFPVGGDIRGTGGVSFGSTARISGRWVGDDGVAFTATVPAAAGEFLWRAATYDTFELSGWQQTITTVVAAGEQMPLLAGSAEDPNPDLTREATVSVRHDGYRDAFILSPGAPTFLDQPGDVLQLGADGWFVGVKAANPGSGYAVTAAVLRLDDETAITGHRLEAASEEYPAEVADLYTAVPDGAIGPAAQQLLDEILAGSPSRDPYDIAVTMRDFLRSDANFHYQIDVRDVPCDSASAVECFALTRRGYCLHYASTMAILLRAANPDNPIPTRLVQGFLPGDRAAGVETVRNRSAHAWVEVFFPGYGWIPFDPTGGGVGRPPIIRPGPAVESAAPTPSRPASSDRPDPTRRIDGGGSVDPAGPGGGGPGDRTLFVVLAVLLAVGILAAAAAAWLRGPRGEISPEGAWQALARAASRFGFAPRPTQTVYEYATALGDLVPAAEDDIEVVATAKVETAYGNVRITGMRLDEVRVAMRRLRLHLLRLVFRRQRHGTRRRR